MPHMSSSAQCCETKECYRKFSSTYNYSISIKSPFRLIDVQPDSCGCRGFNLHCDDELGLLLELPYAGNFTVEYISYHLRETRVFDPNECLPQKLLTLNLTATPFGGTQFANYQVYNCSGFDHPIDYLYEEKIDCLSGSDYTVISERRSFPTITDTNCSFLKQVSVPTDYVFSYLSTYSSIYLTWDDHDCVSCGK
ncbi:putative RING-H2 finger protein ATL21A [Bienertia sinuspersici]